MNKKTLKKRIAEKEMQIQRERAKQDRIQRRMDEIGRRRVSAAEKATKERFLVRLRLELYEVNNRLNWLNMELWGLKEDAKIYGIQGGSGDDLSLWSGTGFADNQEGWLTCYAANARSKSTGER